MLQILPLFFLDGRSTIKCNQAEFKRPLPRLNDYFIANYYLFTNRFGGCTMCLVFEWMSNESFYFKIRLRCGCSLLDAHYKYIFK